MKKAGTVSCGSVLLCPFCLWGLYGRAHAAVVEQAQVVMPEISVYICDEEGVMEGLKAEDISANIDGAALEVKALTRSEQGIFYIFMLDVSSSMPSVHFRAAKQAVLDVYTGLSSRDKLAVITFGNDVALLLDGGESTDEVRAALESLAARDDSTMFNDAIGVLVDTATAVDEMRRVAVVISDGLDDTDAGISQGELELLLQHSGVAVYALAIDTASTAVLEQFQRFIHLSGGELYPYAPDNVEERLAELLERIGETWQLTLSSGDNRADGKTHTLSIRLGEGETLTAQVLAERWIPDTRAPYITRVSAGVGEACVEFSEAMEGLEQAEFFLLRDPKGVEREFSLVQDESGASRAVTLRVGESTDLNGWTLSLSGLSDASMEKNALPEETLTLGRIAQKGAGEGAATGQSSSARADVRRTLLLLAGIAALAGILIAVLLRISKAGKKTQKGWISKRKKKTPSDSAGQVQFLFHTDAAEHEKTGRK